MKIHKISVLALVIAVSVISLVGFASAAVWTNQNDYSPGSTVIISGDNSDGAGYVAGETVDVNVAGPYGTESGSATVGDDGSFSWQFVLPSDDTAAGDYSYTVTGEQSGVSQSGSFTDATNKIGSVTVTPSSASVSAGNSTMYAVTVTRDKAGEFIADLSIVSSNLPAGATPVFSPSPLSFAPADTSKITTLTISTLGTTVTGGYYFSVKATNGSGSTDNATSSSTGLTITTPAAKSDQTITVNTHAPASAKYGSTFGVTATADSDLGVAITTTGECSGSDTSSATVTMTSGTGTCTVHYNQAGDAGYNPAQEVTETTAAQKADATIDVDGWTGVYDGNPHGATGTATGVNGEDLSSLLHLGSTFTNVPGGTADWTFDGNDNYNPDSNSVGIVISKADATCSISGYSDTYDGDAHGATGSCTGVKDETLAGLDLGNTFTNVPGGTANWTFTDVTGNYNDDSESVAIDISKADATIVVTPYDVIYNGNPHTTDGSATGVKGETLSGLDLTGTTHTNAGDYTTDVWTFTDVTGNYNDATGTVHDNIAKADQTIDFTNPGDQIFGSSFALSANASSGLPVSFESETPSTCTVTGSTVHVIGAVSTTCTIKASQLGNGNYNAAPDVSQSFNVLPYGTNKKLPPITIAKKDFQKGSTIPVKFTITSSIDGRPVSWAHVTLSVNGTLAVSSGNSNSGNDFRYDTSGHLYIFNLSTKMSVFSKGSSYTLTINLDDGEVIPQTINIK